MNKDIQTYRCIDLMNKDIQTYRCIDLMNKDIQTYRCRGREIHSPARLGEC